MQIKSSTGVTNAFSGDLSTRLEELAQKARDKASALKTETGQDAEAQAQTVEEKELDFSNAQDRSAFLASLQGGNETGATQTGEMLNQHSLDPARVAQLLDL